MEARTVSKWAPPGSADVFEIAPGPGGKRLMISRMQREMAWLVYALTADAASLRERIAEGCPDGFALRQLEARIGDLRALVEGGDRWLEAHCYVEEYMADRERYDAELAARLARVRDVKAVVKAEAGDE